MSSGTTLVTSATLPPPQQQSTQQPPVAVVIAAAAPPPLSQSSAVLLPPLKSCGASTTILSSSATTSSITTPIQHLNNGSASDTQLLNTDSGDVSNGESNSTPISSASFSISSSLMGSGGANNNGLIGSSDTPNNTTPSIASSDEFVRKLIEAVRKQPCLYNPNHEHYGNKHSSAQYRAAVWQNLCKELDYPEDPHSLQTQWKRVRDRYVRERRKRKASGMIDTVLDCQSPNLSAAARHYNAMRWIDEFLSESNSSTAATSYSNNTSTATPSNSGVPAVNSSVGNLSTSGEIYYSQHPNRRRNTKNAIDELIIPNHSYRYEQTPTSSMVRTIDGGGLRGSKNESANGSPSSTSSEISVGSAAFGSVQHAQGGQTHLMYRSKTGGTIVTGPPSLPQTQQPQPQHLVHHSTPSSSAGAAAVVMSSADAPYQLLSVPAAGPVGVVGLPSNAHNGQVKEQVMTMIIDPTTGQFYHQHNPVTASGSSGLIGGNIIGSNGPQQIQQQQQQRMYRVVNLPSSSASGAELQQQHLIGHHSQQQLIATTSSDLQQPQHLMHPQQQSTLPPRRKRMAMSQVSSRQQQQQHLQQAPQHEMLIEAHHVQQQPPQTIVIEQGQERILINHHQQLQQQPLSHLTANNPGGVDGMIVQHQAIHGLSQNSHSVHANSTHLQHSGIASHGSGRIVGGGRGGRNSGGNATLGDHLSPRQHLLNHGGGAQQYILSAPAATQHHYDPDSALVETIVSHLVNLNDDEKVVTKMNIQRILMDARFGRGACVRMFREEEQSENMAAAAALEASQQGRHLHVQPQNGRR